jgi:hypothetical protein
MDEQARRFDLSRKDQQAQFMATSGARSASIRASREQAQQGFMLQQAMMAQKEREKLMEMAKYRTPEQLAQLDVEEYAAKKAIDAAYKPTPMTAQEKLAEAAIKEDVLQQIRNKYKQPKAGPMPTTTPIPETADTLQLKQEMSVAERALKEAQDRLSDFQLIVDRTQAKPDDAAKISQMQTEVTRQRRLVDQKSAALRKEQARLQGELEAKRSAWHKKAYPAVAGAQPPVGPVGQQNAPSGLVQQIKDDYTQKGMGAPTTPAIIAEIYRRYDAKGEPRPTREELKSILRAGGIEVE